MVCICKCVLCFLLSAFYVISLFYTRLNVCVNALFCHKVQYLCEFLDLPLYEVYVLHFLFIALIHPIQWTIALPVGATGPAKRQKKTSCIYYRQDRSQSVHSPGGASYFISCLPIDVIASFSFGAKECAEDFLQRYVFEVLQRTLPSFLFFISTE